MQPFNTPVEAGVVASVQGINRWPIYGRLRELSIPCFCSSSQPLQVQVRDATAAIQFWSVTQQHTASRQELLDWLERCWKLENN